MTDAETFNERFQMLELMAVEWNDEMAARFPNASHVGCRQQVWHDGIGWRSFEPVRCRDLHCNRCGSPTGCYGQHECPDRVNRELKGNA
ncbi:hypothetical protein SEA_NITZEL_81 [Mycobacterium phage Nitzel]|uniref:Uncharacterized protein n=1 Tax=Mycobacterium phage Nitzel TaxID=2652404 RepID=A0A5J6T3C1_9CAUD|nr:hypothetical protein I5H70_gp81 [Mycobacterium phage Nitzel]QFG04906.1 hypothetical protein SEA_NITZEL_81 [Mycobacterium phage Nitzel]